MGMTKELLNRSSMGKVKKASAIMENDGIATNWVLVHSNERAYWGSWTSTI